MIYLTVLSFSSSMWALSCGMWDLVPWPGIKSGAPVLGAWNPSHWTPREVQCTLNILIHLINITKCLLTYSRQNSSYLKSNQKEERAAIKLQWSVKREKKSRCSRKPWWDNCSHRMCSEKASWRRKYQSCILCSEPSEQNWRREFWEWGEVCMNLKKA